MKHDEFGPTGAVVIEGDKATLVFRRRLGHPPEAVWKALTDPSELSNWYMTRAVIDGREGGSIDFVSGPSRLHITGRILIWEPPRVFEHEWKLEPSAEHGWKEDAIVRWELRPDRGSTILHLEHRRLNRETALGFVSGVHAFLDRLKAQLNEQPLPDWEERIKQVAPQYPPSPWVSKRT
jgi:uncharacterized protein YndB with AHSA1/START domain